MIPQEEFVMLKVLCSDSFWRGLILEHCLLGNESFLFEESGLCMTRFITGVEEHGG